MKRDVLFDLVVEEYGEIVALGRIYADIIGKEICDAIRDIIPDIYFMCDYGYSLLVFKSEHLERLFYAPVSEIDYRRFSNIIQEIFPKFNYGIYVADNLVIPEEMVDGVKERLLALKNMYIEVDDGFNSLY